jgi:hypothetical protein
VLAVTVALLLFVATPEMLGDRPYDAIDPTL